MKRPLVQGDVPPSIRVVLFPFLMFIRWKRRKKAEPKPGRRPRRRREGGDTLSCVVVESRRVNGSPRQRVVCYLGGFNEIHREKLWLRVDFWDVVRRKLDQLPLGRRERAKIEQSIDRVVPRVPDQEAAEFKKERQKYLQQREELFRRLEVMRLLGIDVRKL